MLHVEWTVLISIVCTLAGAAFGMLGYRRNRHKDLEASAKSDGVVLTEIGYIKSGIDDIKRKQDRTDEQYVRMSERVTAAEASVKQAHRRIDRMEGKE